MAKYLDQSGLSYFFQKLKTIFAPKNEQLPTIAGIPINTTCGSMEVYNQNLNNIITSGFYNAMLCQNSHFQYCTMIVIGYYTSGYCTQIQVDVQTNKMAVRTQINGTWSAWMEIDTSAFYTKAQTDAAIASNFASVSKSITNGTISSGATKKLIGDEYKADITPDSGYYISAITVTMGGVDITSQVFDGEVIE